MMKWELKLLLLSTYLNFFSSGLFLPLYAVFVQSLHGTVFHAGASFGVYTLTAGIIVFIFGKLEDKILDKRKMLCVGYFFLCLGPLSYLFVTSIPLLYLVQVINAIGVGIFTPAWKSLYSKDEDIGKEAQEWSLVDGGDMILISIAAVLGGFLVNWYGFRMLFLLMFFAQVIAFFFCLQILWRKEGKRKRLKN
ncbi:MFS transporter [Candidatus Woesearchaeota archaeon]|nr:MFS transporter [Candidatus Woesearchaeota archaeon]